MSRQTESLDQHIDELRALVESQALELLAWKRRATEAELCLDRLRHELASLGVTP